MCVVLLVFERVFGFLGVFYSCGYVVSGLYFWRVVNLEVVVFWEVRN